METINNVELRDENIYPDEDVLKNVLESSYDSYLKLIELFNNNEMSHEWRFYNDGKAWLCKVQKKKRTIVWMSAWKGFMKATIYLPIRLLDDVFNLDIDDSLKQHFDNTKNVGKSKPCMFDIKSDELLKDFEKVMNFKIIAK